ncbi:speckle-type POZ protein-like isoform X3 [Culex pipiens pallens]|uniref:speckle-type POZ protein-like isoform X3 n=1 Tax=Culex pipiens pallens TaxID=42434 RepID=UPI001953A7D2|nr:speckle-type POZ protein-like isoform X3 [Culex pipiens pallens]
MDYQRFLCHQSWTSVVAQICRNICPHIANANMEVTMDPACKTEMKTAVFYSTWIIKGFSSIKTDKYSSAIFTGLSAFTSRAVFWYFSFYPKCYSDRPYVDAMLKIDNGGSSKFYADVELELNKPSKDNPKTTGPTAVSGFTKIGCDMSMSRTDWERYLLQDDTLSLRFRISLHEIVSEMQKPLKMLPEDSQLLDNYASLFSSGEFFSDLTVVIGKREFPAHRAILAVRSPVFAAMFKHTEMAESQQKRVVIQDIEPHVFEEVLRFIYTDTVQGLDKLAHELLAAADKYALDRLRNMCEECLGKNLSVETVTKTLHLADLYHAKQLHQLAVQFIAKNIKSMQTHDWKDLLTNNADVAAEMFSELTKLR